MLLPASDFRQKYLCADFFDEQVYTGSLYWNFEFKTHTRADYDFSFCHHDDIAGLKETHPPNLNSSSSQLNIARYVSNVTLQ